MTQISCRTVSNVNTKAFAVELQRMPENGDASFTDDETFQEEADGEVDVCGWLNK